MLKYQKAKVKLLEYEVPEIEWPNFPLNYRDLAFPTVLTISQYAEAINDGCEMKIGLDSLRYCSDFYDAALQSREQTKHDVDFALSGAAAYFFMNNYGSAKVLWQNVDASQITDDSQKCLFEVFSLAFTGRKKRDTGFEIIQAIELFWRNGDKEELLRSIKEYRENVFSSDSPQTWFWGEITCAVTRIIGRTSARVLLPQYSTLDGGVWEAYFIRKTAINLMWPSQRLVGESEILRGSNAILQLPTGVGKTKSIELIIWAMFLSNRGSKALIIAPLRSLCNEITNEMRIAFPKEITINMFSDVLEGDFIDILLGNAEKQILVCTPEKLQYIFHHDRSFLRAIDLYIFDESHMFDDRSRGAMYELLLTDIKLGLLQKQQLILMSAVLPNAEQIVNWLFDKRGILAYDSQIVSTPKSIGFVDNKKQLHYYSSAEGGEDFFVPYTYKTKQLNLLGRERKKRVFPEDSIDKALYYSNVLCRAGGVAIFFPQRRTISRLFARIKELDERGYHLNRIKNISDENELSKFKLLYKEYYGEDHIYTQTIEYGILPHYSALPNGIKISTEHSFKKNKVKAVACTSTLAQGVNIPIRYLIITGTNFMATQMSVRNFQNLIGRTGRSGVFTEGDIIVTDNKIYDERSGGRGFFKWRETRELFDATAVEACGSSILNITKSFKLSYNVEIEGLKIINFICDNILDSNWEKKLVDNLMQILNEHNESVNQNYYNQIMGHVSDYKCAIDNIENEIIYLLDHHQLSETAEQLKKISDTLLENTLAYYLASSEEKKLLKKLFNSIETKVEGQLGKINKYSKVMISIKDADQINEWIEKNNINTEKKTPKELTILIENLFGVLYSSVNIPKGFALSWIRGDSYDQISKTYDIKVDDVEKLCQYNMSYQMSFLAGNIVDLVNHDCVNTDALLLVQQALRYGVNNKTSVSVCEKVFNDRFIAKEIAKILGNYVISNDEIITSIKGKKTEVLSLVRRYPSYFEFVIENI